MSTSVEIIRNDDTVWLEGTICDGTRTVMHFIETIKLGEVYYLIDLDGTCTCGKPFKVHEVLGIAVGTVE